MKKIFLALMCAVCALSFSACGGNGPDGGRSNTKKWLHNPSEIDESIVDDQTIACWTFQVWCDGTVIGKEWVWSTEAALIYMMKTAWQAEIAKLGEPRKRFYYEKTEDLNETACEDHVWEGAACWKETITYKDKETGLESTSEEYLWMPEENVQQRHAYYREKSTETNVLACSYNATSFDDKDGCLAQNPNDDTEIDLGEQKCYKKTMVVGAETFITYEWTTAAALDAVIQAGQHSGAYTLSYTEASASNEIDCALLNAQD